MKFPIFQKIAKAARNELGDKNQLVGEYVRKFKGTIGEALAAGIPEEQIIARARDPKLMAAALGNPSSRARALNDPVAKGFTYTESHPYTLEYVDLLSSTARGILRKQKGSGGAATSTMLGKIIGDVQKRAKEVYPDYDRVQTTYNQFKNVIKKTRKRVGAEFDKSAPMGERYAIEAHPGAPAAVPTAVARAGATPGTSGGQSQGLIALIKYPPQKIVEAYERAGTKNLLKTGQEGTGILSAAGKVLTNKVPANKYRGIGMAPGILRKRDPDDEEPPY